MILPLRVTVGTTPVIIVSSDGDGVSALVRNRGAASIFVGDSPVTTSTGYELLPSDAMALDLAPGEVLYGISGSAGQAVHVLRSRVG